MDGIFSSPFDLKNIYSIRCNSKGPLNCKQCESCQLVQKVNFTKAWFIPLSHNSKRMFLERLIVLSDDVHAKIPSILSCLQSKDLHYSNSRVECVLPRSGNNMTDKIEENTNHSLDIIEVETIINQRYLSWYINSSEWTKQNFLMSLLKLCTVHLIRSLKLFIFEFKVFADQNNNTFPESTVNSSMKITEPLPRKFFDENNNSNDNMQKCQSAPLTRPKSALKCSHGKKKRNYSAKERITFKEIITTNREKDKRPTSQTSSTLSKIPLKVVFVKQQYSSARCTPVLATTASYFNDELEDIDNELITRAEEKLDFIRLLPIQISKKIFGYFTEKDLDVIAVVSSHWMYLAKQVKNEVILKQISKEDVMMMQPASAKVPHPCYARNVPVHIPKLDENGEIILNSEATHVDVEVTFDEFHDINMEECYQGWETSKVTLEERNIFCSSYNVLVIDSKKDVHRKIHWLKGDLIAFGSLDRKVYLRNVETAETVRTITGHSGSVKCVYIDEKNDVVISGGYDTTVRVWGLKTGRCKIIFRGHKGSIISLTANDQFVVSASTDSFIKVWNVGTRRCKRTFLNNAVVRAVQIMDGMLLAGCSEGILNIWDVENSNVAKTFAGHKDGITCVKYFKWYIVSGSLDAYVMLWSNVGELTDCLKTFRHPKGVLCLEVLYCRIVTGCEDGKIRLWNLLNGNCLRIIRGNSKNDEITRLFASENRLIVNTESCVLSYNFEGVEWNYTAPRYKLETSETVSNASTRRRPHSYHRAVKLHFNGSPLHKSQSFKTETFQPYGSSPGRSIKPSSCLENVSTLSVIPRGASSVSRHVSRIQSAQSSSLLHSTNRRDLSSPNENIKSTQQTSKYGLHEEQLEKKHSIRKQIFRARCRSAPAHRVICLPPGQRGFSTTGESLKTESFATRKMIIKPVNANKKEKVHGTNPKCLSTKTLTGKALKDLNSSPSNIGLTDLKIKTYEYQLKFEENLKMKR